MRFRAGTTHSFKATLSDYSGAEWTVYLIANIDTTPERIDLTESDTVAGLWEGKIAPAISENWDPACYSGTIIAEKDGDKYVAASLELIVAPNPITGTGKTKLETELELVKTAITALLNGKGVKSYQIQTNIGSRQLERMALEEIQQHRKWLERRITAEKIKMGLLPKSAGGHRIIGTKFRR